MYNFYTPSININYCLYLCINLN